MNFVYLLFSLWFIEPTLVILQIMLILCLFLNISNISSTSGGGEGNVYHAVTVKGSTSLLQFIKGEANLTCLFLQRKYNSLLQLFWRSIFNVNFNFS